MQHAGVLPQVVELNLLKCPSHLSQKAGYGGGVAGDGFGESTACCGGMEPDRARMCSLRWSVHRMGPGASAAPAVLSHVQFGTVIVSLDSSHPCLGW